MKYAITTAAVLISTFLGGAAAHAGLYTLTDLTNFGAGGMAATSINDNGQIVFDNRGYSGHELSGNSFFRIPPLGILIGDSSGFNSAYGINNSGWVVGASNPGHQTGAEYSHAYIYANGFLSDIGPVAPSETLGGAFSYSKSINNIGQVVGTYYYVTSTIQGQRAFLYSNGVTTALGSSTQAGFGIDINDAGQVLYSSGSHAFLYSDTSTLDLGIVQGYAINNSGIVTGSNESGHAFLYSNGTSSDLGSFGLQLHPSVGYGINDSGQVVGTSVDDAGQSRAFIYSGSALQDLNQITDLPAGWMLTQAQDINNAGQIIGYGTFNGQGRPFLLTPEAVPEPSTALFGVVSILALCFRRTRK